VFDAGRIETQIPCLYGQQRSDRTNLAEDGI